MTRSANSAIAAFAAFVLSLASVGAIVTVPPAQAAAPSTLSAAELA